MATPRNQSVLKAFAMLKAFHSAEEWAKASELSRRAKLPKASGYRILQTLAEIGAVVSGPHGRYKPGMLLVSLSHVVAIGELLNEACQEIATGLAQRFNLTIYVGVLEGGMVKYVAKVATPLAYPAHTRVGSRLEAYCSGLGKVLLASLPRDEMEGIILDGDLVPLTPYTITEPNILYAQLEDVRRRGFAVDDRECQAEMVCVAAPIFDDRDRVIAAISATDSAIRMTPSRKLELREALRSAALAIRQKVYPDSSKIVTLDQVKAHKRKRAMYPMSSQKYI